MIYLFRCEEYLPICNRSSTQSSRIVSLRYIAVIKVPEPNLHTTDQPLGSEVGIVAACHATRWNPLFPDWARLCPWHLGACTEISDAGAALIEDSPAEVSFASGGLFCDQIHNADRWSCPVDALRWTSRYSDTN